MKHAELVNCQGTRGSGCHWLFTFTSWGTRGENTKPSPASAGLKASAKISALLQQESEK